MRSFINWAHSLVHVVKGARAFRKQDYNGVIEHYSRAIELSPEDIDYYYKRGAAYLNKKQYGSAVADYTKIIELNPEEMKAFFMRGLINRDRGFLSHAIEDLSRAIEFEIAPHVIYYARAECYLAMNEKEKGLADLEQVLAVDSQHAHALQLKKYWENRSEDAPAK